MNMSRTQAITRTAFALVALATIIGSAATCFAQDTLVLQQKIFFDQGNQGPVPSHTILVPQGWTAEGKAYWAGSKYYSIVPSQDIELKSPAGLGIHIGPNLNATDYILSQRAANEGYFKYPEFDADKGRMVLYRPSSLKQWKSFYEEKCFPELKKKGMSNLRIVEVVHVPELQAFIDSKMAATKQRFRRNAATNSRMNFTQTCDCDAIALRFQFEQDGVSKEAVNILGLSAIYSKNYLGTQIDWNSNIDVTFSAPEGRLEAALPTLVAIACSTRQVPSWSQQIAQHLAKLNSIALNGQAKRSQIMADAFREVSRIQTETYQNTSRASDRIHNKYINALREVDTYSQGEYQYELPSGYDHVFGDGSGNFIMTNDAMLNPNTDLETSSSWTPLNANR